MSSILAPIFVEETIVYPESDGKPMANNTAQFDAIVKFKENLEIVFAHDPDVLVVGDLLWYPVQGCPDICCAPDVMVVFGRPKGYRGSYRQWEEGYIPPQVVFEILSTSNTKKEMDQKFTFYEQYGVEEYYLYDPERNKLRGWLRTGNQLSPILSLHQWTSPRMQIRFEQTQHDVILYRPDGQEFLSMTEFYQAVLAAQQEAEQERKRREQAEQRAEKAEQRAEKAEQQAEKAEQQAKQFAALLRQMGIDPDTHFEQN